MYVCICEGVTEDQVRTAVRGGARTIEDVGDACGAGTGCGSCHDQIDVFLLAADARLRATLRRVGRLTRPLPDRALRTHNVDVRNDPRRRPIIALLNEQLTSELTAINQYFLHSKMQQNWGSPSSPRTRATSPSTR